MTDITVDIAKKVLTTVDAGLTHGIGIPVPGRMCVEAVICYALGLPHDDDPPCVSIGLRCLKIILNDSPWSSKKARAKGLRRLALAQLGSNVNFDEQQFARGLYKLAKKWTTEAETSSRRMCPPGFRPEDPRAAPDRASPVDTVVLMRAMKKSLDENSWAEAIKQAGRVARRLAATHVGRVSVPDHDQVLSQCIEDIVQLLIEMNAPGCQWLYLTGTE